LREVAPTDLLGVCAWCRRVSVGGRWAEPEDEAPRLRLFGPRRRTHGICEDCLDAMAEELASAGLPPLAAAAVPPAPPGAEPSAPPPDAKGVAGLPRSTGAAWDTDGR
jgi:hypothetical protein